jgi:tripartite-type tricarboxylate transporter receptor subunit TctC
MRATLRISGAIAALAFCAAAAAQADYPSKPIRLITPFNPGGAIDIYSRMIAEPLAKRLGQNVVVEPIAGANTIVGTQALARAAPDGHTFMITTMSTAVNNRFRVTPPPYDPDRDLQPITQLSYGAVLLVAPVNAPYRDARGLVDWVKAQSQSRTVTYGSWGVGSWGHIAGLILQRDHGLKLEHVPYKGDVPALTDVQNGGLDVTFASPTSAKPRIAAGAVKPIGMTGPQRSASMPDLATFSEQGVPNVDLAIWVGAYAPAGTPRPIVERLQRELAAVIHSPEVRDRMLAQGQTPIGNTPEEFTAAQRADVQKWGALIRGFGLRIE